MPSVLTESGEAGNAPVVGLLVTCLVDAFRPSVGFAAVRLLEAAGCRVEVPLAQTCCGQPAYNAGDRESARRIARDVIALFEPFEHVVAPSGSCASVLARHYPDLLADDAAWRDRAAGVAAKTHELLEFLADVRGWLPETASAPGMVATYHDSCSGLRELGVRDQPRRLLGAVDGLSLVEMEGSEVCCGFGGAFCVKYPDISEGMADAKIRAIEATGAGSVLAGDLGCLLHLAGRLGRLGSSVEVRHTAEVLAGALQEPAIGKAGAGESVA